MSFRGALGLGGDGDSANCHLLHRPGSSIEVCKGAYEHHFGVSPGRTYRAAAELCGTSHKTVKRVVERGEAGGPPPRSPRPRNFDAVTDLVAASVDKSNGRISAKRLLPVARAAGYQGSARNFRRLVAEQKMLWRKENAHTRRPAVWTPGEYLVMDWDEAAPGLFVFCAVLAYSRWRFVRCAADQKASTTLVMVGEALAAVGGVPAKILADRVGCLKGGVVANVVVPTPDYVRFASHYGFSPDFCHGADRNRRGSWKTSVAIRNPTWQCPC